MEHQPQTSPFKEHRIQASGVFPEKIGVHQFRDAKYQDNPREERRSIARERTQPLPQRGEEYRPQQQQQQQRQQQERPLPTLQKQQPIAADAKASLRNAA